MASCYCNHIFCLRAFNSLERYPESGGMGWRILSQKTLVIQRGWELIYKYLGILNACFMADVQTQESALNMLKIIWCFGVEESNTDRGTRNIAVMSANYIFLYSSKHNVSCLLSLGKNRSISSCLGDALHFCSVLYLVCKDLAPHHSTENFYAITNRTWREGDTEHLGFLWNTHGWKINPIIKQVPSISVKFP